MLESKSHQFLLLNWIDIGAVKAFLYLIQFELLGKQGQTGR